MAPVLSLYIKRRIISLSNLGKQYTAIWKIILRGENKNVSRQAVASTVRKFKFANTLTSAVKSGRKKIITMDHLDFLDQSYDQNDEFNFCL